MSTSEKMTIHKALCELKIIGDRIYKEQNSMPFVFVNEQTNKKVQGINLSEYIKLIESAHQSTVDLIARRDAIKRAVVLSNATTTVVVGGKQYTVAEAIEMKNHGLEFYKKLLQKMVFEMRNAKTNAENANGKNLEARADGYIRNLYGATDMKSLTQEATEEREKFIKQHTSELVDPLKLDTKIAELEKFIYEFSIDVDAALSTSNAVTEIEVSY